MLFIFAVMYAFLFVEILETFAWRVDGPILTVFKVFLGYPWDLAGYLMVLILDILIMVGSGLCYYGSRWTAQGLKLRRRDESPN